MPIIPDHEDQALARLIEQYKETTTIKNIIRAIVAQTQDQEPVLDDLQTKRALETSEGVQLDLWGVILNQSRGGLSDAVYRALLFARVAQYNSQGTADELIAIFEALTMPTTGVDYVEFYPGGFCLTANDPTPIVPDATISQIINQAKPAGVEFCLISAPANPFVFAGNPIGGGFEAGEFASSF